MSVAFAQENSSKSQAESTPTDVRGEIDVNPQAIVERVDSWVDGIVRHLPNIGVAIVVVAIFVVLGIVASRMFRSWAAKRDRDNLGEVIGGFIRWLIIGVGVLLALTIVVPTLQPGDLIAGLGVGSVAIGFAFKDILQNWLAGILILMRQPFEVGDQIIAEGYEGTVERIETRATVIKTYDGRQVLIPNSDVYTNAVLVNTAFEKRRSQYDIGIGYGDSIDDATSVILDALRGVDGVESDPAPEVICAGLGDFAVLMRARWWTDSRRSDVVHVQSNVMIAVKKALDEAGIDMPFETQVHLWHDQTEEIDGDRAAQREGWPEASEGDNPKPRHSATGRGSSRSSESPDS
ncbi:MAG: mechanosensitive ion channel family protein [Alphaproteobacteria bacterium]|nr:mechanosensitive ion channel family protein [Alphaproteobacteria bacterium]